MKKFTLALTIFIAGAFNAYAQIPNPDFEIWQTTGSYQEPTGWATMNPYCTGAFYSCTKSTDHYPSGIGNYSMRIESNTSLGQTTGGWGVAVTDSMAYPFAPAFPIVGHPTSLTGYVKYDGKNGDTATVGLVMFNNGTQVFHESQNIASTGGNWTSFNFTFPTYTTVDSATIIITAYKPSGPTDAPNGNSVLHIDNLNFDNLITSVDDFKNIGSNFSLFPNPTSNYVILNMEQTIEPNACVNVYNVLGKLVSNERLIQRNQKIDVSNLNDGIYFVEIISSQSTLVQRLLIQR